MEGSPGDISRNAEIVLLRAAQEALANIGRHAKAKTASVKLTFDENMTSLEVADDGVGFDAVRSAGFGLSQLRSRVDELSGTTEVSSAWGEGTKVRVVLPTEEAVPDVGLALAPGPPVSQKDNGRGRSRCHCRPHCRRPRSRGRFGDGNGHHRR